MIASRVTPRSRLLSVPALPACSTRLIHRSPALTREREGEVRCCMQRWDALSAAAKCSSMQGQNENISAS